MHQIKRLASAGATLTVAIAAMAVPASAATSTTRWVDGDGHAGPNGCGGAATAFTSIQDAVTASHADGIVVVCPGTYTGQVRIRGSRDGLTLRSSSPFTATIKAPVSIARPLGFGYVVLVDHVDDVTIRGFKVVSRTAAPCDQTDVTIAAIGSRHTSIRGDRLLAPGSNGNEACSQGIGIAVANEITNGQPGGGSSSFTATATIAYNEIRDARFGSIATFGVHGRVDVDIVHNSVRAYFGQPPAGHPSITAVEGAQFGIGLLGRSQGTVRGNVIQGSSAAPASGPSFFGAIAIMPGFDSAPTTAVNGPITVSGNLIRRVVVGIIAAAARDLDIRHNHVSNAYAGVELDATTASTLRTNRLRTKGVGITLSADSTGNRITGNTSTGLGGYCQDGSSGSGTSGTANTWSGDSSTHGSNPSGICDPAP